MRAVGFAWTDEVAAALDGGPAVFIHAFAVQAAAAGFFHLAGEVAEHLLHECAPEVAAPVGAAGVGGGGENDLHAGGQ